MGYKYIIFLISLTFLFTLSFSQMNHDNLPSNLPKGLSTINIPASSQKSSSQLKQIPVDIFIPKSTEKYQGDILVLPGWNYHRRYWYTKTNILKLSEVNGLRLAFPEMGKTLYASRYYPHTQLKWGPIPGGQWVQDYLLPALQKHGLFLPGKRNFIMGLSTGGRGVALISLNNPGLFKAGASISGDFDQSNMPKDRLMTKLYGPYKKYKVVWKGVDNPQSMIDKWQMPIYLGHGRADRLVPFSQTKSFYNSLKKAHPKLRVILNDPKRVGHNWKYWSSEVQPIIAFFITTP